MRTPAKYLWRHALVILSCLGAGPAAGQQASEPSSAKPDYSNEAFVDEDDSTKISVENDGTGTRETSVRIRLQSDAAVQRYGVLTFPYQSAVENVEIVHIRVGKPDGTVIETPKENTQDMPAAITQEAPFYSDLREKHVSAKGLGVGDVLESDAVWHVTKPLAAGQFWLSFDSPADMIVLRGKICVSLPRERAVKWTSSSSKPSITEEANRRLFTWSISKTTHASEEQKKATQAQTASQAVRGRLPSPEVELSTFASWEEVGAWYRGLAREREQPTAEIRAKAKELAKNTTDGDARIRAIYNYVSTQIRYIGVAFGIGRYQPHSAAEVLSNQYGDCKDKHTLLASLLAAEGIRAFPALINSARVIDEAVPSPGQFDHVITAIPRGDGFIWLDTTAEVAPFGYLLDRLRDKRCLVIPGDGPALLVTTAADPPVAFRQTFRMEARLSDVGTLEGSAEGSVSGGDYEVVLRAAFRRASIPQWKDLVQLISYRSGFGGDVSDVTASSAANTEGPFRWTYKYTRKDYSDWPNRRVSSPLPVMGLPDAGEKASQAIWLGSPGTVHFESSVVLPAGSAPQLPPNRDVKEAFADYSASYRFESGTLKTDRTLVVKRREVPVTEYEVYRKFAKAVQDDHDSFTDLTAPPRITPVSYQEAIWRLPSSQNIGAERAYDDARAAYERHDADGEIASLKRAVAVDPEFTRAWLWMGEIYRSQAKQAPALEAYRSAIKNSPREPLSYKILAFNLMRLGRLDDSIATWRQLIEMSAEDPDAFAYLGWTLSAKRRHAEAASALESAIKLDPARADLSVQLGTAYAHVGEWGKALAAFQRGLDKDPQPAWLNEAAYALADANKQLPLALEYAERAVRSEEGASANVVLSRLKREDLAQPVRLAAYWDTLGWVYARMGRLDRAEKYLNAAWILSQMPAVGDHLGQVCERLRKREDAIRMYQLALAAGRAPDSGSASDRMKEIQARLDHIRGKPGTGRGGRPGGEELTLLRTVKLQPVSSATASAEFFLLIGQGSRVLEVRFISGAEELKAADKALKLAAVHMPFPDDGPARVVRRGVVSCSSMSGCSLVFYAPALVRSLD